MVRSVPRTTASVPPTVMSAVASSLKIAGSPLVKSITVTRAEILFSRRIVVLADALQPRDPQWQRQLRPSKELQHQISASLTRASARRRVMFVARPSPRSASSPRIPFTAALARTRPQWRRSSAPRICASQQLATTYARNASVPQAVLSRSVDRTFLRNARPTVTQSTTARQALIRSLSRLVFAHQESSVWMEPATMMLHAAPLTVIALVTWWCAPTPSPTSVDCSPTPYTSALIVAGQQRSAPAKKGRPVSQSLRDPSADPMIASVSATVLSAVMHSRPSVTSRLARCTIARRDRTQYSTLSVVSLVVVLLPRPPCPQRPCSRLLLMTGVSTAVPVVTRARRVHQPSLQSAIYPWSRSWIALDLVPRPRTHKNARPVPVLLVTVKTDAATTNAPALATPLSVDLSFLKNVTPSPTPSTIALMVRAPNLRNSLNASQAPSATRRRPPLVPPVVE
ncbi:MAG: hypothetical protein J3R72DRAFT_459492 [Linnemannia gamsii]|nr:MAG: hypothetical protein J3R72DRAFT_459492 [Linnemannia gamsii]